MPEEKSKSKHKPLNHLRDATADKRGDVIIAKVSKGARNVIIGKNIIKIGTLVVPAVHVFVGVVVLLAVIAFAAYLYFVPATMPPGPDTFNIAVAEFGELDATGEARSTPEGQSFSAYIYRTLRDDLKNSNSALPGPLKPVVWHDSMFPMEMRTHIGLVQGKTPAARRADAILIASDLGANVVIYGNLVSNQTPPAFVPEFYVAEIAGEVDEVVGQYQFGAPIDVHIRREGIKWSESLTLDETVAARQRALAYFTIGLIYDLEGKHEKALDFFQPALVFIQGSESREGQEVLYYFIGREHLFLAQEKFEAYELSKQKAEEAGADEAKQTIIAQAQEASAQVDQFLDMAETAFIESEQSNPAYARAHLGLGQINRMRALRQLPRERLDQPEFLARAFQEYQQAIANATSDETNTLLSAQAGLAALYFLRGEAFLHRFDWNAASVEFDHTIKVIEDQLPQLDERPRAQAEAYLTLGNAYYEKGITQKQLGNPLESQGSFAEAINYYAKCIELKKYDKTLVRLAVSRCERYQAEVQRARMHSR